MTPTAASTAGQFRATETLPPAPSFPRPLLRREACWQTLDGEWGFAIGQAAARSPDDVVFADTIRVPFAPECPASGVGDNRLFDTCWYRRTFPTVPPRPEERVLLHFEAVDDRAEVWMNGRFVGRVAGPARETLDITTALGPGDQALVVRVFDDPRDLTKPRGKQDWQERPHGIWYPRTTGIWQTVWLERVPARRIAHVRWTPHVPCWELALDAQIEGDPQGLALEVELSVDGRPLASDRYALAGSRVQRGIRLEDPGIDDARAALLWSPEHPNLIDAELRLVDAEGAVIDRVASYAALRSVAARDGRFLINGRPCFLRLVLAQGYWRETGLTPPDDDALRTDIELVKALGFNGVRLHQKVEAERYLYWADKLGLLVWGEMGSSYAFSTDGWQRVEQQWAARVRRDVSHPCIIAWVPVNESWGLPDLPEDAQQRAALISIDSLAKALDPTRPVIGNDGWEMGPTDVIAIHDYDGDLERFARRYDLARRTWSEILGRERPGQRGLLLPEGRYDGQPVVLSEFGGMSLRSGGDDGWGYTAAASVEQFAGHYARLLRIVNAIDGLAGFCYTQFTDTYQEINGLVTMDRVPKAPVARIRAATRGERGPVAADDVVPA